MKCFYLCKYMLKLYVIKIDSKIEYVVMEMNVKY